MKRFVTAISATNFQPLTAHWKNRNKTEMKIRSIHLNFSIISFARVAYLIVINIITYSGEPYSKNIKHLIFLVP